MLYSLHIWHIFFIGSSAKRASPAQSKRVDDEEEHPAATATPDSAWKRRAVNKHGLQLTKSGRVAGTWSAISINAKYDAAYRNAKNDKCGPGWCWISSDAECPEVPCSVHDKSQIKQNIQNIHIEMHI